LQLYEHGGDVYGNPGVTLDFSVNTNPLGMPQKVREAITNRAEEFARYPDPHCRELVAAIARHENVPEAWILCGNGAADLIYRLCYALKPRRACVPAPTFSEYGRALSFIGCEVAHELTLGSDIAFLCHPNNPTGLLMPEGLLEQAIHTCATVVVDECFLDFTEGISAKQYLASKPGLVILKAFTKTYAMAGLRLGYILSSDTALLEKANAAGQSWSVSVPAQIAGVAALACAGWLEKTRVLVKQEREYLAGALGRLSVEVFPSDANFLLLKCETPLYGPLLEKGILIRSCANFRGLDESYYRVSVKKHEENIRLVQAVGEVLRG
jgi:threonine-phosphate decarboxylase